MNAKITILTFVFLAFFSIVQVKSQVKDTTKKISLVDRNSTAIQSTFGKFEKTWNEHNAIAFSETFAEDADFTNVFGQSAHGRQGIEKFHSAIFLSIFKNSKLTVSDIKIRFLTPGVAVADVFWNMSGATNPDGTPWQLRKGLLNAVMMPENGEWLIKIMHNMDLPGPK